MFNKLYEMLQQSETECKLNVLSYKYDTCMYVCVFTPNKNMI